MAKVRNFTAGKEENKNLEAIREKLEELKDQLVEVLEEYEDKNQDKADILTEALDALEVKSNDSDRA